ncbi:MAG: Adenosine monophosphate-protein transferase SoFic [Frankiales bacterium]|nr:Adenosine monophosphate-protein transferase SoFic [Frankiales bacterium]
MSGRWTSIKWQGRPARAWVPEILATDSIDLGTASVRKSERAAAAVRRADELLPGTWEPIARILLRTEGVASSNIEGLRAPIEAVVAAEIDDAASDSTAAWIADNLAAVTEAVGAARQTRLSVSALHRWHRQLMRHGDLPRGMVGSFRSAQGWIGGTSPIDAVYVPSPPTELRALMADLVAFANRADVDPVAQAAVLHAQFETIHPYGDGNGRLGRILVSWLLARRLDVALPPPVSVLIARDPGGYLSGLHQFREGSLDAYVGWFGDVVMRAGDASVILGERIRDLLTEWEGRAADLRSDAAARRLVAVLPEHPVLTSRVAAEALGISERGARNALQALADRSILMPSEMRRPTPGRPSSWWVATELLRIVGTWAS